jgi:opacity protein-like surface antigen
MRKFLIGLAASIFTMASAAAANAQVTGIRHSDGSWTFVDANGRDIHADYDAGRAAPKSEHHDLANQRSHTSRHYRGGHKVSGYLPWLPR